MYCSILTRVAGVLVYLRLAQALGAHDVLVDGEVAGEGPGVLGEDGVRSVRHDLRLTAVARRLLTGQVVYGSRLNG